MVTTWSPGCGTNRLTVHWLRVTPAGEMNSKTLGRIHMQVSYSTAATYICTAHARIYECLAAPSRPSSVSRLFHAVCTSS